MLEKPSCFAFWFAIMARCFHNFEGTAVGIAYQIDVDNNLKSKT